MRRTSSSRLAVSSRSEPSGYTDTAGLNEGRRLPEPRPYNVGGVHRLRWAKPDGANYECAYLGDVEIAMIGAGTVDYISWWYTIYGVTMENVAKRRGAVSTKAQARDSVERAWKLWCRTAGLCP